MWMVGSLFSKRPLDTISSGSISCVIFFRFFRSGSCLAAASIRLSLSSGVIASAVVPYPDPVLGERACLFVQSPLGVEVSLEAVCDALDAAGLAKFKWPERLERIDEMPLTPTRKVIRGRLRELL